MANNNTANGDNITMPRTPADRDRARRNFARMRGDMDRLITDMMDAVLPPAEPTSGSNSAVARGGPSQG